MEPAHTGEREATTDRVVSVAGSPRAGRVPDIEMLDSLGRDLDARCAAVASKPPSHWVAPSSAT